MLAAITKTGNHLPWDAVTNSAVSGPQSIPGIVAYKVYYLSNYKRFFTKNKNKIISKINEINENLVQTNFSTTFYILKFPTCSFTLNHIKILEK